MECIGVVGWTNGETERRVIRRLFAQVVQGAMSRLIRGIQKVATKVAKTGQSSSPASCLPDHSTPGLLPGGFQRTVRCGLIGVKKGMTTGGEVLACDHRADGSQLLAAWDENGVNHPLTLIHIPDNQVGGDEALKSASASFPATHVLNRSSK
eukprot:753030-Hanusia_phi.AAC.3